MLQCELAIILTTVSWKLKIDEIETTMLYSDMLQCELAIILTTVHWKLKIVEIETTVLN